MSKIYQEKPKQRNREKSYCVQSYSEKQRPEIDKLRYLIIDQSNLVAKVEHFVKVISEDNRGLEETITSRILYIDNK